VQGSRKRHRGAADPPSAQLGAVAGCGSSTGAAQAEQGGWAAPPAPLGVAFGVEEAVGEQVNRVEGQHRVFLSWMAGRLRAARGPRPPGRDAGLGSVAGDGRDWLAGWGLPAGQADGDAVFGDAEDEPVVAVGGAATQALE